MRWESPPVPEHGLDWARVAGNLRAHPGEWLRLGDGISVSVINAVRQASIRALQPIHINGRPGFGYEVKTRNNDRLLGTATLYMRYVQQEGES
jgi:hypothetical protein